MALLIDKEILGEPVKKVYVKIINLIFENRDTLTVRVLTGEYLSQASRLVNVNNIIDGRNTYQYSPPTEEELAEAKEEERVIAEFFTDERIKMNGAFSEAYHWLKSLDEFSGATDV